MAHPIAQQVSEKEKSSWLASEDLRGRPLNVSQVPRPGVVRYWEEHADDDERG